MRTTIHVLVCDICKNHIIEGELWIDYGVNRTHFHWTCLRSISAVEFITLAYEGGDQMYVRDSIESDKPYHAELKHLLWKSDPDNLKNILTAHRINKQ